MERVCIQHTLHCTQCYTEILQMQNAHPCCNRTLSMNHQSTGRAGRADFNQTPSLIVFAALGGLRGPQTRQGFGLYDLICLCNLEVTAFSVRQNMEPTIRDKGERPVMASQMKLTVPRKSTARTPLQTKLFWVLRHGGPQRGFHSNQTWNLDHERA